MGRREGKREDSVHDCTSLLLFSLPVLKVWYVPSQVFRI